MTYSNIKIHKKDSPSPSLYGEGGGIYSDRPSSFLRVKVLIDLSATADIPLLFVEYISLTFFSNYDFIDLL